MHYKNGRIANENDPVIGIEYGKAFAGTLHSLNSQGTSCNGQVAVPVPGTVWNKCVTVGELYHAEDAFNLMQAHGATGDAEQPSAPPLPGDPRLAQLEKAKDTGDEPEAKASGGEAGIGLDGVAHRVPNLTQANIVKPHTA